MERITSTKPQALMAKKACKMAFLLLKKSISSLKKLAGKSLDHAFLLELLICGGSSQNDVVRSYPVFKEYEFSCSNSPAFRFIRRRGGHSIHHRRCKYRPVDEAAVAEAVQRVFDMLNTESAGDGAATPMALPGFGKSPAVRQLRVTDSPFPVKENEEESRMVSKAAEEFIRKFYRDLNKEKSVESPCVVGM